MKEKITFEFEDQLLQLVTGGTCANCCIVEVHKCAEKTNDLCLKEMNSYFIKVKKQ
jgi:hypothetical protein